MGTIFAPTPKSSGLNYNLPHGIGAWWAQKLLDQGFFPFLKLLHLCPRLLESLQARVFAYPQVLALIILPDDDSEDLIDASKRDENVPHSRRESSSCCHDAEAKRSTARSRLPKQKAVERMISENKKGVDENGPT